MFKALLIALAVLTAAPATAQTAWARPDDGLTYYIQRFTISGTGRQLRMAMARLPANGSGYTHRILLMPLAGSTMMDRYDFKVDCAALISEGHGHDRYLRDLRDANNLDDAFGYEERKELMLSVACEPWGADRTQQPVTGIRTASTYLFSDGVW